ncbi:aldehyde dehydrogenase family protein, partial [Caballeronia glebae]|uniref:aldehyde dehydrogenase family protein n=1 Tax=Caballeronia glebae TaxID=1777143 RepID=UPI000B33C8C4
MISPVLHLKQAGRLDRFFIDGEWTLPSTISETARTAVICPSTEETLCEIPLGNSKDVDHAVLAARKAFPQWSATSPQTRAALLDRVHGLMIERSELFARALTLEMGAPINYARGAHVPLAIAHLGVARDNLLKYPFIVQRGTTAIAREPVGV